MTPPDPSTYMASGLSAEVFALGEGQVLKLFHDGIEPATIAREYAVARVIGSTGLPVARVIGQRQVGQRQGIVYSRIDGPTLIEHIRHRPWRARWALCAMARLQHHVHQRALPGLRSRKQILGEDIELAGFGPRLADAALNRLALLQEGDALSHGDLHPGNLIVTGEGRRRGLAVIDWSKAACAAPAADVVRTEMLLRFGPWPTESGLEGPLRDAAAAYYVHCYRKASGMGAEALSAWRALVALAWVRQRLPGRDVAFARYLADALKAAGLPEPDG